MIYSTGYGRNWWAESAGRFSVDPFEIIGTYELADNRKVDFEIGLIGDILCATEFLGFSLVGLIGNWVSRSS